MKELLKKHSALEKTEQRLKSTMLDLNKAKEELEVTADPDISGSVSKLESSVSEWLLVILI